MEGAQTFVGREPELAQLSRGLDEAESGEGRLFLIAGEPGIGKSRLCDEYAALARARDRRVLWGRCWEAGGAPAYWPWVQAIRAYIRELPSDDLRALLGVGAADVAQMLPEIREILADVPVVSTDDAEGARFRLFDSTANFLRRAASASPLVAILEDLHAADTPSLLLLQFLARELTGSRIVVLATYRDTEVTRDHPLAGTLAELIREPATSRIRLGGFNEDGVSRLIEAAAEHSPSTSLVAAVHRETEGNPLFVGEIVRLLAAEGRLDRASATTTWRLGVPEGIRAVILRRLGHLSYDCTRVLSLAAIIGQEFGLDILERLAGVTRDDLVAVLADATMANVVTDVALGRMRFGHALFRESLYEELPAAERSRLHRTVAEILEFQYANDLEPHLAELAHHFFGAARGGDAGKALLYSRLAAARAAALLAYEEATRLYGMALEALELEDRADDVTRAELLLLQGEAEARAGESAQAQETFLQAGEIARRRGMPQILAKAALGRGGRFVWQREGHDRHLVPLLEDALSAMGDADHPLRVRLLARLACALRSSHARERSDQLSREAVEIAERLGDRAALAHALDGRWGAIWWPENTEERMLIADRLIAIANELDDKEILYQGHHCRWAGLFELGDIAGTRAEIAVLFRLAEELRQPSQHWVAAAGEALLARHEGRFAEAEILTSQALRHGYLAQLDAISAFRGQTYALRREQGRLAEVEDDARRSVDEFPWYAIHSCALAFIHVEAGRIDEARRIFDALAAEDFGMILRDNEWLLSMAWLSELAARLEDGGRAAVIYRLLLPHAARNVLGHGEGCAGSVERYVGIAAATAGLISEAIVHLEAAVDHNRRMDARPFVAHAQHELARVLQQRGEPGDRERGAALQVEALATADELGMTALAGAIRGDSMGADAPVHASAAAPPANAFIREGEYWSVSFDGDVFRVRDSKGMRYVAFLLGSPGKEFHALELTASDAGGDGIGSSERDLPRSGGDAGAILDPAAKEAYRRRLKDLEDDIKEARDWGDDERAARGEEERDALVQQLAGAVGLGGRDRRAASDAERARVNVTRAIKAAVTRIAEASQDFGSHLEATIRTGTYCSYTPDPRAAAPWRL